MCAVAARGGGKSKKRTGVEDESQSESVGFDAGGGETRLIGHSRVRGLFCETRAIFDDDEISIR